jgi:hypothetical protein
MIKYVGAFENDGFAIHLHRVEPDLDRLFGELLGHLLHAVAEQSRRARQRWIPPSGGQHRKIETVERITHGLIILASKNEESENFKAAPGERGRQPPALFGRRPAGRTMHRWGNITISSIRELRRR